MAFPVAFQLPPVAFPYLEPTTMVNRRSFVEKIGSQIPWCLNHVFGLQIAIFVRMSNFGYRILDYPSHKMCIPFMVSHSDIKYIDNPKSQHFHTFPRLLLMYPIHMPWRYPLLLCFSLLLGHMMCSIVFPWSAQNKYRSGPIFCISPSYLSHSYPHYSWFYMVLAFYPPYAPLRG